MAEELCVHPSSLRRRESSGLIAPERATMGKTTLRICDAKTMRVLRRTKALIDAVMSVREALGLARAEMEQQEDQHHD